MCFRPADTNIGDAVAKKCPACGKTIQAMGGVVVESCPFCKSDLAMPSAAPSAPAAPGAPAAPKA